MIFCTLATILGRRSITKLTTHFGVFREMTLPGHRVKTDASLEFTCQTNLIDSVFSKKASKAYVLM